jgi:hypothetical protein
LSDRANLRQLGIGAIVAAILLAAVAIPGFVSAPSNVPNIILSPLLWPYTIAGFTFVIGLGLLAASFAAASEPGDDDDVHPKERPEAWMRLLAMAVVMGGAFLLMPVVGMVWTSMAAFMATALIIKTRHPLIALMSAITVPLVLYAFFAHVAGVAIPQGQFIRLP